MGFTPTRAPTGSSATSAAPTSASPTPPPRGRGLEPRWETDCDRGTTAVHGRRSIGERRGVLSRPTSFVPSDSRATSPERARSLSRRLNSEMDCAQSQPIAPAAARTLRFPEGDARDPLALPHLRGGESEGVQSIS
jgi:hypothetical protein